MNFNSYNWKRGKLKISSKKVFGWIKKIYMIICNKIYGINNRSVVFISFGGKSYSDNPKAISEKLHEINPEMKIIWLFNNPRAKKTVVPEYITCYRKNSFKALKALATSKFWVDNFNKPLYVYKSKKQVYIQTWHGDRAFKKILYDAWPNGRRPEPLLESEICDVIVTGSDFGEKMYRSAFRYRGKYLRVGSPRNDSLINTDQVRINRIKSKLALHEDDKIVLYAPTFRKKAAKQKVKQKIDIDLLGVIHKLNTLTNNKWVCLVRAHSAVSGLEGIPGGNEIIDVTEYEDMADLLQIADLLITDYSSSATDLILTNKPIILYHSDYEEYKQHDREFYYDINMTGFFIAKNQEELYECIDSAFKEDTAARNKKIREFYGVYESGEASTKVVEYILDQLNGSEFS